MNILKHGNKEIKFNFYQVQCPECLCLFECNATDFLDYDDLKKRHAKVACPECHHQIEFETKVFIEPKPLKVRDLLAADIAVTAPFNQDIRFIIGDAAIYTSIPAGNDRVKLDYADFDNDFLEHEIAEINSYDHSLDIKLK